MNSLPDFFAPDLEHPKSSGWFKAPGHKFLQEPREIYLDQVRGPRKTFRVFDQPFHPVLRKFRKMSRKYTRYISETNLNRPSPIRLSSRAVLRAPGPIDVESVVTLHKFTKCTAEFANEVLKAVHEEDRGVEENMRLRSIIRTIFEETLKSWSQLSGIVQCDPHTTPQSQELFEQFFQVHGNPNEAERFLLAEIGGVNVIHLDEWFMRIRKRLRVLAPMLIEGWAREIERAAEHRRTRKPPNRH